MTVAIRWIGPLYQTPFLLVIAYAILFIPRAMVSIRAALAQAPGGLLEAALARRQPVAGDPAGAAAAHRARSALRASPWSSSPPVSRLTATLLLAPTGTTTLATGFWAASDGLDYGVAAPYALMMILVSARSPGSSEQLHGTPDERAQG